MGPVAVALARAAETIPAENALPGGVLYEMKYDGFRLCAVSRAGGVRVFSRRGVDLSASFPDIVAAAAHLPRDSVVDGEVVIWHDQRLDFDLLQQRLAVAQSKLNALVDRHPASYVVFDLLALRGRDIRQWQLRDRRAAFEALAADWAPPLQLSPQTGDMRLACEWLTDYRPAGIEGVVAKGAATVYAGGQRQWIKVKSRETHEIVIGAVLGPIARPEALIAGLYRDDQLVIVGRTALLTDAQSRTLAAVLEPAGDRHPWPERIVANRFGGGRNTVALTRVEPRIVAVVSADAARQAGGWRHSLRYLRLRADLDAASLPPAG
jgi:ATP-dependent DNA ligase